MEMLLPFGELKDNIEVHAEITPRGKRLDFRFELRDPGGLALDSLRPGLASPPARADQLWKTTCFEAFWALPGERGYWELNISPSGKGWNCYRFEDYRSPASPAACLGYELTSLRATATSLEGSLSANQELRAIEASLCAIVRTAKGTRYFSTAHAGARPDFHLRESFIINRFS
jgi:hypothetical protein